MQATEVCAIGPEFLSHILALTDFSLLLSVVPSRAYPGLPERDITLHRKSLMTSVRHGCMIHGR
jgi:hypothetical protein